MAAFCAANGTALLAEMRPEAEAVAERVTVAVEQLRAALQDYNATGNRVVALTGHVQGIDGRDVVNTSEWAGDLPQALRQVTEGDGIPAPRKATEAHAKSVEAEVELRCRRPAPLWPRPGGATVPGGPSAPGRGGATPDADGRHRPPAGEVPRAAATGLPLTMAERLHGDTPAALAEDARAFAPFLQANAAPPFIGTAEEEHARVVGEMFGPGHGR